MPDDASQKPVIFISYSQRDQRWLDYVRSFFGSLERQHQLRVWDDETLRIGGQWREELDAALDACRIFIVLVSRYSLASAFVLDEEIPRILERPRDAVELCPIVVTPCDLSGFDWLKDTTRRPRGDKSLFELRSPARDREMVDIVGQIAKKLEKFAKPAAARKARPPAKMAVRPAKPPVFPSIVDYQNLPTTPYKKLVGREAELQQLDDFWDDGQARILSLIGWGGVGKTTLVIEWLTRMRDDGFRGADAVLCWSFYSQGSSSERAPSGEAFLDWALGKLRIKIDSNSSTAKGERLAEEFLSRRMLLLLDGLEPLQFSEQGQHGPLKDQGVRTFLRTLAAKPGATSHGLVLLTSRLEVDDLMRCEPTTTPLIQLWRLKEEAGAALLADQGVEGSIDALRTASRDFGGHALGLNLLGGYLRQLHGSDVSRRDRIRPAKADLDDSGHDQVRRVLEALDAEWLAHEPRLLAVMYMMGLFDRPASADCIAALRREPVIDGFNNDIVNLDDDAWSAAINRLREVRLLDPEDASTPDSLDAHPLVREWFGDRLRAVDETAWRAAHGRLFGHLQSTTRESRKPTLDELLPLYQAIAHGCRAGRHKEALNDVYIDRISGTNQDGSAKFYSFTVLSASGNDLAALSWFFEVAFSTPLNVLPLDSRSFVLNAAAYCLRTQGRLAEALSADRAALDIDEGLKDWLNAGLCRINIADTEYLFGEIESALSAAKASISLVDTGNQAFWKIQGRASFAEALTAAGRMKEAQDIFIEAEQLQEEAQREFPLLYSLSGYKYCEFLLEKRDFALVKERASRTLEWSRQQGFPRDVALDTLMLGRCHLGIALSSWDTRKVTARYSAHFARTHISEAFHGLHATAVGHHMPRGFLARAALLRSLGDWAGAALDLDEAEEIAGPGPMKLYLCDIALERTRLAFAQIETFAPLNGLVDRSPPKPAAASVEKALELKAGAARQLETASGYIESCGYRRRDGELAELQAALRGERKFADLTPRV